MTVNKAVGTVKVAPPASPGKMSPAQTAMKGQTFAQSGLAGLSGQQGMASGISTSVMADAAMSMGMGIPIVGAAMGPRTSPSNAKAANR